MAGLPVSDDFLLQELLLVEDDILDKLSAFRYVQTYFDLQGRLQETNVSTDTGFQKGFKAFYRIRKSDDWCQPYFALLEREKQNPFLSFTKVISSLEAAGLGVHASFSSKLLATVRPEQAVYDSEIRCKLRLKVPTSSKPVSAYLSKLVELYSVVQVRMQALLADQRFQVIEARFDERKLAPGPITTMKKLDFLVWAL